MALIRGALQLSKDIAVIMLSGVIYILGLSVATLISASED